MNPAPGRSKSQNFAPGRGIRCKTLFKVRVFGAKCFAMRVFDMPTTRSLFAPLRRIVNRPPAALISLADQGVVSGFGFLSGIAAARFLGIAEFGQFALIMIILSFAQGLHNALITAPMMTLAGARGHVSRAYGANVVAAAFLLSIPGAVFAVGALTLSGMTSVASLVAACTLMVSQNLQFTLRRLLFAKKAGLQALLMDFARAASFPVTAALVWLEHGGVGYRGFVWMLALTSFATALPFMLYLARPALRAPGRLQLGAVSRRHAPIARWLLPVVFVTFAQEQLVWIAAGSVLGLDALGGLRAAQYLVGTVLLLLTATENVLPGAAARAYTEGGEPALKRYLVKTGFRLGLPIVGILLVLVVPAEFWLGLIFGPEFAAYAACLRILAFGVVVIMARDLVAHYFRARQNTRVIFESLGISMVASLVIVIPLITRAGVSGAAAAVTVGHVASLAYLVLTMYRQSRTSSCTPSLGAWPRWPARAR